MKEFIRVMKALSDPNRVKMMKMLQNRPLCVCEIQQALGVAQSTASKHLKILEDADLVRSSKDGLWVNYSLSDGSGSPVAASMIGNLKHWLENEIEIKELTKIFPGIDRNDIVGKEQKKLNEHIVI
jgi:ArsR family transcriptional regulator